MEAEGFTRNKCDATTVWGEQIVECFCDDQNGCNAASTLSLHLGLILGLGFSIIRIMGA